jgi:FAD/FMN-containing dehydrogenase
LVSIFAWLLRHYIVTIILFVLFAFYPQFGKKLEANENFVKADDVTRMNATKVKRIFMVKYDLFTIAQAFLKIRTEADIIDVLRLAKQNGLHVSIRGQKHTMGGQTIAPDGYVIDMTYFKTIRYLRNVCSLVLSW